MVFDATATYKIPKDVVKAQDVFDDHVGADCQAAERAEVMLLLICSDTNALDKVLHACKITMTQIVQRRGNQFVKLCLAGMSRTKKEIVNHAVEVLQKKEKKSILLLEQMNE